MCSTREVPVKTFVGKIDAASGKIVGFEDQYKEAMEHQKLYYGDPCRVMECVIRDVKGPGVILDGACRDGIV